MERYGKHKGMRTFGWLNQLTILVEMEFTCIKTEQKSQVRVRGLEVASLKNILKSHLL